MPTFATKARTDSLQEMWLVQTIWAWWEGNEDKINDDHHDQSWELSNQLSIPLELPFLCFWPLPTNSWHFAATNMMILMIIMMIMMMMRMMKPIRARRTVWWKIHRVRCSAGALPCYQAGKTPDQIMMMMMMMLRRRRRRRRRRSLRRVMAMICRCCRCWQ